MRRFAVIGLGRFGQYLARALTAAGDEVIGIDLDADVVERMRDEVALAVRLDGTDKAALADQGGGQVDAAIVCIGEDFESAALTVAALHELGVSPIIARALTETRATILRSVGADEIALAEQESAQRWARRLTLPSLENHVELGRAHSLVNIKVPSAFCQHTLAELALRKKYGVNVVAVRRQVTATTGASAGKVPSEEFCVAGPEFKLLPGDTLVLVGSNEGLDALPLD